MKTVRELMERIEARYSVGHPTNCSRAVTGELYVVIGAQHPDEGLPSTPGTRDEGKRGELAFDEETAVMQAAACFDLYAEGRGGKIYYRHPPQLEWNAAKDRHRRCVVYLRCLISDKPEIGSPCKRCNCGLATP